MNWSEFNSDQRSWVVKPANPIEPARWHVWSPRSCLASTARAGRRRLAPDFAWFFRGYPCLSAAVRYRTSSGRRRGSMSRWPPSRECRGILRRGPPLTRPFWFAPQRLLFLDLGVSARIPPRPALRRSIIGATAVHCGGSTKPQVGTLNRAENTSNALPSALSTLALCLETTKNTAPTGRPRCHARFPPAQPPSPDPRAAAEAPDRYHRTVAGNA